MMRRLAVLMAALLAVLTFGPTAAPAEAHVCSTVSDSADFDPTPDDVDGDCVRNAVDNCTSVPNADQVNSDNDPAGDACDDDDDNDGVADAQDNCRTVANPGQERTQHPIYGDVCLKDTDGDGWIDAEDNCRRTVNPDQANNDGDAVGDLCDADDDNDGFLDNEDNCPILFNKDQANADGDALGNACDPDYTGETFVAPPPTVTNPVAVADRSPAKVTLKLASVQRGADARGGMATSVRCSEACSVSAELTLSKAVARKHKLGTVVAKGDAALEGAGGTYVFFDFTKTALKRLFRGTAVKATLKLRVLDAAGNATSVTKSVKLSK